MLVSIFNGDLMPQVQSDIIAMGEDVKPYVLAPDPTVLSPAIAVTVWSVSIDFSLSPFSVYFGDTIRFSGKLTEYNGTSTVAIAGKPIDVLISNAAVTSVIAHTDYTCTDGTFTLAWTVGAEARVGTNYFYARSSW
jgi:hypothetical protein